MHIFTTDTVSSEVNILYVYVYSNQRLTYVLQAACGKWPAKVMQTVGIFSGMTFLGTSLGTSGSSNDVAAVRHSSV